MPFLLPALPAIIGAGAGIIASSNAKSANSASLAAQTAATQQQLDAQRQALDRITGLNQPYITGGTAAFNALLQRYGITPTGGAAPVPNAGGTVPAVSMTSGAPSYANTDAFPTARIPQPGDPNYEMYRAEIQRTGGTLGQPVGGTGAALGAGGAPGSTVGPGDAVTDPPKSPSAGGAPGSAGGQPNYAQGLIDRPDVKAEYDRLISTADPNSPWFAEHGLDKGPEGFMQWWATQGGGAQEGYQVPLTPSTPPAAQPTGTAPATPSTPSPSTSLMDAARPDQIAAPTFGAAPDSANYFKDFQQSPGYQFILDQATRGANAGWAGRGLLKSDSAVKAIMGQASGLAAQDYNNWVSQQQQKLAADRGQYNADRSSGLNLWNVQNTNQNSNFTTDRQYQTNRYNTDTGNIFDIANMGLNAAGNVSGAVTNNANNSSNIFGSQADAQSAHNAANAQANNYALGGVANAAGSIFGSYGGSTTPIGSQTSGYPSPSLMTPQTNYPDLVPTSTTRIF